MVATASSSRSASSAATSQSSASASPPPKVSVKPELFNYPVHECQIGGLTYRYIDEGKRTGTPVLMVHGNPTWSFYYRNLIGELREHRRCLAPDHIGCGRSERPDASANYPYTLERRVQDLGSFIDHLNVPKVDLVCHDWGGMIGLSWAVDHPGRVGKIVLSNTSGFLLPHEARMPSLLRVAKTPLLGEFLIRGLNAFCRCAQVMCVEKTRLSRDVARGYLAPYRGWKNRKSVYEFVKDIPLTPQDRSYSRVLRTDRSLGRLANHPILLCWGLRDFVFSSPFLDEFRRRFPRAQVAEFGDCGHYLLDDAGDEAISSMMDFLLASEASPPPPPPPPPTTSQA